MSRKTEIRELEGKLVRAESRLRGLGYELLPGGLPSSNGTERLAWRLSREAWEDQREEREAAKAAHQRDIDAAVEQSRLDTLAVVIDALELTDYGHPCSDGLRFYSPEYLRGVLGVGTTGPERLWSDIETALALRAEKKADADRQAAADRFKRATRHPLATGGYTGTTGLPAGMFDSCVISVDKLSAASVGKLAEQLRAKVVVDPKPTPVSKKPKAKKKAAKK